MNDMLLWLGRLAGFAGIVVCAIAGALRLSGAYWLGGFQIGTLLVAGVALLATGCFLLLVTNSTSSRPPGG
jgi:hypothetical protein